jgi:hypothetical protein
MAYEIIIQQNILGHIHRLGRIYLRHLGEEKLLQRRQDATILCGFAKARRPESCPNPLAWGHALLELVQAAQVAHVFVAQAQIFVLPVVQNIIFVWDFLLSE